MSTAAAGRPPPSPVPEPKPVALPLMSSDEPPHAAAVLRPTGPQLVIDLTDVRFLGAAGLTALVTVRDAAVASGTSLCAVARTRVVLLPLTITGLDRVFDVYPDLADVPPFPGDGPDG